MDQYDDKGWAPIHHATYWNSSKSVERFVTSGTEQLEMPTRDRLRSTPLLLAVSSASLQTTEVLVSLGADVAAVTTLSHGVVEVSASMLHVDLLEYFISLKNPKLDVYQRLIKFLDSDSDEEATSAGQAIVALSRGGEGKEAHTLPFIERGLVSVAVNVLKKKNIQEVKEQVLNILNNVLEEPGVKEQIFNSGGLPTLTSLLHKASQRVFLGTVLVIKEIAVEEKYAEALSSAGVLSALLEVLQLASENIAEGKEETFFLILVVDSLCSMAQASESCRNAMGKQKGFFSPLVGLLEAGNPKSLLMALCKAVSSMVARHPSNQTAFLKENGEVPLVQLLKVKSRDLQLGTIQAIYSLAEGNEHAQKRVLVSGGVKPLMQLLTKSRTVSVQEVVAETLWVLAGEDIDNQRSMASLIGVSLLTEFLCSLSERLQFRGLAAISVLAQSPRVLHSAMVAASVPQVLVRLLRSEREAIVLGAVRALRPICLGVCYTPHPGSQRSVAGSRGMNFLVALLTRSHSELLRGEVACTLAAVVLGLKSADLYPFFAMPGNSETAALLRSHPDFSYGHVLRLLYSLRTEVRLLAGIAIATFAFNSVTRQRAIAESGGVRWHNFQPFLRCADPHYQLNAAFQGSVKQTQVKAVIEPDPGIPAAIVAIDTVSLLCGLLSSSGEQVQGSAAIALGYLSFNHQADRQLLKRYVKCIEQGVWYSITTSKHCKAW
ncbi:Ankyrin and armadillo repeat-containing protein [Acipenser ruthenus]|uniref:Ankyrin and armadillo repeat-containing protein n=1 Tax=Acipenser ruthenus TaxID=7906 RepID=A0A444UGE0_ACIRT|nr:Ankyrin and armadillo repeat-containing protein [Acipenser ruthenus]